MNKCEKCGFLHYRTDPCRAKKVEVQAPQHSRPLTTPKPDRNKSRHRPGYFTEYMRQYRARKKASAERTDE